MRKVSALVFSMVADASFGQQPFPTYADSGTWSTLQCIYGVGTVCLTTAHVYIGTDTFCGHTWSTYTWPTFGGPNTAYLRNEGQRTFLRRTTDCLDKEYLIYDFSMQLGDTVYCPMNMDLVDPDTAMFILQNIDTVDLFGVERRRFSLLYDRCNDGFVNTPMEWIEGIGSTTHPFYPVDCLCDFCEQSFMLLCYDSSGVQLYQAPGFNTCDTMITGINEVAASDPSFEVHYDAAGHAAVIHYSGDLTRDPSGSQLWITTVDGRNLVQEQMKAAEQRVPLGSIAPGVYHVLLTKGGRRIAVAHFVVER